MDAVIALAESGNCEMGEELVRLKLAEQEAIDQVVPVFEEHLRNRNFKRACLLKILTWDLDLVDEKVVLDYQVEEFNLGYCNVVNYDLDRTRLPEFTFNECWVTMSLPIDFVNGVFFVSTASFLSANIKEHWEKRLTPNIIWFLSDLSSLTRALEQLEKEEERAKIVEETEGEAGEEDGANGEKREGSSAGDVAEVASDIDKLESAHSDQK